MTAPLSKQRQWFGETYKRSLPRGGHISCGKLAMAITLTAIIQNSKGGISFLSKSPAF